MADDDEFMLNLDLGGGAAQKVSKPPASRTAQAQHNKGRTDGSANKQHRQGSQAKPGHEQGQAHKQQSAVKQHTASNQHDSGSREGTGKQPVQQSKQAHSRQRQGRKSTGGFDDDQVQLKGADSDEEAEIAALVSQVAQRDAAIEQELQQQAGAKGSKRKATQEEEAVVDFDDNDRGKRRKRFTSGTSHELTNGLAAEGTTGGGGARTGKAAGKQFKGANKASAQDEAMKQQPTRVTVAPGQLTHGGVGEATADLFMSAGNKHSKSSTAVKGSIHKGLTNGVAAHGAAESGTWQALGLSAKLCDQLSSLNFERPTKVQCAAIPPLVSGRDVLVRAATGSGKTLSYLVPIIHDLAQQEPHISRADGSYALVVAPTRELCLQIQDVAVQLLKRFIWLVAGVVIGGENRTHEKARLRKGVTLLVATPGRLADHLHSTASFKTDQLRWLVLDEADRLLDLGFEARLKEIVQLLDAKAANKGKRRVTALLSATLHSGLASLASVSLQDPVAVGFTLEKTSSGIQLQAAALPGKQGAADGTAGDTQQGNAEGVTVEAGGETYVFPSQLQQAYMVVEAKQRLVTLAGLLRQKLLAKPKANILGNNSEKYQQTAQQLLTTFQQHGYEVAAGLDSLQDDLAIAVMHISLPTKLSPSCTFLCPGDKESNTLLVKRKAVVFLASCDGVELHHTLLGGGAWRQAAGGPLLGHNMPLLKLHGDMPQEQRTAAFVTFTKADCAVLLCTDVAARGLDFPDVTLIIQYDVPGASAEYVHRVGRTARIGHAGEAIIFLMPHEKPLVQLLSSKGVTLSELPSDGPLRWLPMLPGTAGEDEFQVMGKKKKGGGQSKPMGPMGVAYTLQRKMMQAVAEDVSLKSLAADAFRSFVRAYATHSGDVKKLFHVRDLHLGHVAFAHGLKEAPAMIGASGSSEQRKRKRAEAVALKQRSAKKQLMKKARAVTEG